MKDLDNYKIKVFIHSISSCLEQSVLEKLSI